MLLLLSCTCNIRLIQIVNLGLFFKNKVYRSEIFEIFIWKTPSAIYDLKITGDIMALWPLHFKSIYTDLHTFSQNCTHTQWLKRVSTGSHCELKSKWLLCIGLISAVTKNNKYLCYLIITYNNSIICSNFYLFNTLSSSQITKEKFQLLDRYS